MLPEPFPVVTCSRRLEWDSLHRVPGHGGACRAFHGHRYAATITCAGPIDEAGMIIDFGVVKTVVGGWIAANWDHTAILWRQDPDPAARAIVASNEAFGRPAYLLRDPPTAENLALELVRIAHNLLSPHGIRVVELTLAETPNCYATWRSARTADRAVRAGTTDGGVQHGLSH